MRLHITGATGYLGSELVRLRPDASTERVEIRDGEAVPSSSSACARTSSIHTAYRQDGGRASTRSAPRTSRVRPPRVGARLVHLSTDVVFDGRKGAPYVEADPPRRSPTTAARRPRPRGASPPPIPARCSSGRRCSTAARTPSKHELAARDPAFTFFTNEIRSPVQVTDLAAGTARAGRARRRRAAARRRRGRRLARRVRGAVAALPVRSGPAPGHAAARLLARLVARAGAAAHAAARRPRSARLVLVLEPLGDRLGPLRRAVRERVDLRDGALERRSTIARTLASIRWARRSPKSSGISGAGGGGGAGAYGAAVSSRPAARRPRSRARRRAPARRCPSAAARRAGRSRRPRGATRRRARGSCRRGGRGRPCRRCRAARRARRRGRGSPRCRPPARPCAGPSGRGRRRRRASRGPRGRAAPRRPPSTASRARGNAKKNASPCVSISTPPRSAKHSRISRRWSARSPSYRSPSCLSSAVEPSMSLKTNVTVPLGRAGIRPVCKAPGKLGL